MTTTLAAVAAPLDRARPKVLVTTVSSDAHTWNLVWVQLVMEELGCEVVNLGPCVPDDLVVESCLVHRPDMLVVSSVNGHGAIDGARLVRQLRETSALEGLPVVIGGKLGITGGLEEADRVALLLAGYDLVLEDGQSGIDQLAVTVRESGRARELH